MSKYQKELLFKSMEETYKDLNNKQLMIQEYYEEDRVVVLGEVSEICAK
jgi:hypothetical protein